MASQTHLIVNAFTVAFQSQKQTVEKAVAQLPAEKLRQPLDENTNSVAVIMKHMAGNLRSRFADFLTSDGEKPDRDRDAEFIDDFADQQALMTAWEAGWKCLFDALATLTNETLEQIVTIRGQPHTVAEALTRALAHVSYHAGQIVQLSRYLAKDNWKTLTIPRGESRRFNETMRRKFKQ